MLDYCGKFVKKTVKNSWFCCFSSLISLLPDNWLVAFVEQAREESPGSIGMRCQITSGGENPRESATENRPPNQGKGEKVW